MESLNNESPKNTSKKKGAIPAASDTKSAGRPKMKDNNDDNEFATTPLKASVADVAATHAQAEGSRETVDAALASASGSADAASASSSTAEAAPVSNGSADKVEETEKVRASIIEQKLNARMDDLAQLIVKAGSQIQRLGESLCRIGDKLEHLPERRFTSKKEKPQNHNLH